MPAELSHFHRNARGFTLVELLVVIAIIALLVSILLPALQKAKAQGEQAKCSVHLRQMGVIHEMWSEDNDRYFPSSKNKHISNSYLYIHNQFDKYSEHVEQLWHCPTDKRVLPHAAPITNIPAENGGKPVTPSYNYNRYLVRGNKSLSEFPDPVIVDEIKRPSSVVAAWDGNYMGSEYLNQVAYYDSRPVNHNHGAFLSGDLPDWYPHNRGKNYLAVDGHVVWLPAPLDYETDYMGYTIFPGTFPR